MSVDVVNKARTRSLTIDLEPVEKIIRQIKEYLNSDHERDVALTSLLNWFSVKTRNGESAFDGFLLDRETYAQTLREARDGEETGRAHDSFIMSVANDIVAQIEMAASFRRAKPAHHFAKSRNNITWLGKGAEKPKISDSVLEEYTSKYLQNAMAYVAQK